MSMFLTDALGITFRGVTMRRVVLLLLIVFASWRVEAGATAACPFYAINSSNYYACFQSQAEAEEFIRDDAGGTRPARKHLEMSNANPPQVVSNDATSIDIYYTVKPKPGVVGAKGYKTLKTSGASTSYELCGCDTSGMSGKCMPFGPTSNCQNQPDLCTFGNYCNSRSSLSEAMIAYQSSQQCHTSPSAGFSGGPSGSALSFDDHVPDNRPIYPPNTGTLGYSGTVDGEWVGGKMVVQWNDCEGQPAGYGEREVYVVAPLTCPTGYTFNRAMPPKVSEACISNEWGLIQTYRAPVKNPTCSEDVDGKDGCYGNPVVAATGAKIQSPKGWSSESMLGLTIAYNSLYTDSTYGLFGGSWASLLSARFVGNSFAGNNYAYSDPEGNIETFWASTNGIYRPQNSSDKFMRSTSSSPCDITVFEAGRRLVFGCYDTRRLERVEYPDSPIKNLTVVWSASEAFDSNGVQTVFYGVPTALVRADGRRLDFFYSRVNPSSDCDAAPRPYACNAIRLTAIHDNDGNITLFDYNTDGRLSLIYYPDGTRERFEYGAAADICPSTMPGSCNGTPHALLPATLLTGTYIETPRQDGGFDSARYGIYQYDNYGRAIVTTHPGDAGRTEFRYAADRTPTVRLFTDSTHYRDRTIVTQRINGLYDKPKAISETDSAGVPIRNASNTYGSLGYLSQSIDYRGVTTDWTFNDAGLPTQKVEAANDTTGNRRTRQIDWNVSLRLATEHRLYDSRTTVPGTLISRSSRAYNARGQATASCQVDPGNATAMAYVCGSAANAPAGVRQMRNTYCEQADVDAQVCPLVGLVIAVDGPRTDVADVSTLAYYSSDDASCAGAPTDCPHHRGDLWKMTNSRSQTIEVLRYDGASRALSIKDANGIVTDLEYSARGWLKFQKVRGADDSGEADDAITRIDHDAIGRVIKVTQPDGTFVGFTHDAAHRLTKITDALGNSIRYVLDYAGNRTQEQTSDNLGELKHSLSRLFNNLGQIQTLLDANGAPTALTYDLNGNGDTATDAMSRVTDSDVDPLNRVWKVIANASGSANERAVTQFVFDARDKLTSVIDPKGLTTTYSFNGLGDQTKLVSPDTGNATNYTYDAAGNRLTQVDARGKTTGYGYDSIGRLITQTVPTIAQNIGFDYDLPQADCSVGETYSVGRLVRIRDESGSTRYCYDRLGRLVRKVQTVVGGSTLTVGATYSSAGRLRALTYPSGAIVAYMPDDNGQIKRIDANPTETATQVTLVKDATYLPFGPLNTLTYGNDRILTKTYDQNYGIDRVADSSATGLSLDLSLNTVGNVVGLTERTSTGGSVSRTFTYDGQDRLTGQKNGASTVEGFGYDATGNRTSKTVGSTTTVYSYANTTHRLSSVGTTARSYDNNGNTSLIGTASKGQSFAYDDRNRLRDFKLANKLKASYRYNGKGERVLKTDAASTTNSRQYVYDEAGHLLGEYTTAGMRIKEYVWLDNTLVAILSDHDGSTYQFVETDHLGTPRAVIHPTKHSIVWRWDATNTAFGDHAPLADPDANSITYTLDARYSGQWYDSESGLHYNYFRDYDATTGRYLQSDPIGLAGGQSTFNYVGSNPLDSTDFYGLINDNEIPSQEKINRDYQQQLQQQKAMAQLVTTYNEMKSKDVRGTDQFYHCMGACRASKVTGDPALVISLMSEKEMRDYALNIVGLYGEKQLPHKEMMEDIGRDLDVNNFGANCPTSVTCVKRCSHLLDNLKPSRRKYMIHYRPDWKE
jgi:RHS repeat-associated protein